MMANRNFLIVCLLAAVVMAVVSPGCEWSGRERKLESIQTKIDRLVEESADAPDEGRDQLEREAENLRRDQDRIIDAPTVTTGLARGVSPLVPGGGSVIGLLGLLGLRRFDEAMRAKLRQRYGTRS